MSLIRRLSRLQFSFSFRIFFMLEFFLNVLIILLINNFWVALLLRELLRELGKVSN